VELALNESHSNVLARKSLRSLEEGQLLLSSFRFNPYHTVLVPAITIATRDWLLSFLLQLQLLHTRHSTSPITMAEDRERSRSPDPAPAPADEAAAPAAAENGGGAAPAEGGGSGEEVKLYIGNLDYATDEAKLREEFGQFGTVTDVFLPVERGTQRPRGFGFVTYSDRPSAENAISKMDQAQLDGRTIRVNESRPKGSRAPGGGGGFNASGKEEVKVCHIMMCTSIRSCVC